MNRILIAILLTSSLFAENIADTTQSVFYNLTKNDTIDRFPKYDFVSDYDWGNASLGDLPYYVYPKGVTSDHYYKWESNNKDVLKNINLVDMFTHINTDSPDSPKRYEKDDMGKYVPVYEGKSDKEMLLELQQGIKLYSEMDLSECKLTKRELWGKTINEFYGDISIKDSLLECIQLEQFADGFKCRKATEEEYKKAKEEGCREGCREICEEILYDNLIGLGFEHIEFTDINNDDYMDVLIWFYEIGKHTGTGNKQVILTKTSEDNNLFEIIELTD